MRPSTPAAAFAIGVLAAFALPAYGGTAYGLALAAAAVAAMAAAVWLASCCTSSLKTVFQAAFLLGAACLGMAYALLRTDAALSRQVSADEGAANLTLRVAVSGLPARDEWGRTRFSGTIETADGHRLHILFHDYQGRDWPVGSQWQITARLRPTVGSVNPAGFNRESWALSAGIDGLASVGNQRFRLPENNLQPFNRLRAAIAARWQRQAADYPQGAALMKALAVGDRSGLTAADWAAFRPLGLNHLISISGLHVGMVGIMAAGLARRLMRHLPRLLLQPQLAALAVGWLAAGVYTGLAGFEVPALRSLLMLGVFALAWRQRADYGVWGVWWAALAAVLLLDPAAALSAGFWFSFGLVGVLVWAFAFRLPETRRTWRSRLKQAAWAQSAAAAAGMCATAFWFGQMPLFSPVANALAIPFFSWCLVPLALAASVLPFDMVRELAAWLAQHTMDGLRFCGEVLPEYHLAHAPLPLFAAAMAALLLLLLPRGLRLKPLACCILAAFVLYRPAPPSGSLNLTVHDVGQGLAVSLRTPSQHILFDTGTPAAETLLLPNLRAQGIRRIDHLVLSHHDNDHDGGHPAVAAAFDIGSLWAGQPEFYTGARHCRQGSHWTADGVHFEFLTPLPTAAADNDRSCVLRVISPEGQAVLLTGDLGAQGEQQLLAQYGDRLYSQVLFLGHHGSNTSSGSRFIHTVSPVWAVASAGFANPFKHPHPAVQTRLRAHGVQLLRTDRQGALHLRFDRQGIHIEPQPRRYWWQRKPFADRPPTDAATQ